MKPLIITCAILLFATSLHGQARQEASSPTVKPSPAHKAPAIIKEPTVLGVGATWAVVSWTTNSNGKEHSKVFAGTCHKNIRSIDQTVADNVVDGPVPSYQEQEYAHVVRLDNLKPGTTYYFQADSGGANDHGPGSKSNIWTFTTSPGEPALAQEPTGLVASRGRSPKANQPMVARATSVRTEPAQSAIDRPAVASANSVKTGLAQSTTSRPVVAGANSVKAGLVQSTGNRPVVVSAQQRAGKSSLDRGTENRVRIQY